MLARDMGMLHPALLRALDELEPEARERELARWRALYSLEAEERASVKRR